MEHYPKYLKGIALSVLASVIFCGSALAVPTPTYPRLDTGSDEFVKAPAAPQASAPGARILTRSSNLSLARGTFRGGGASSSVASISTNMKSRSKARYYLPGMVLAALTPLALHHSGDPGDKSVAVQTRPPSSSLPSLNDALLGGGGGRGHGRGGDGDNDHSGGGDGDGEDCNNDEGGDNGDEVCDTGDYGDNEDCGDCEDNGGDCDNGGGGGGGDHGGGDNGGGGGSLPEPGTVPLIGAGLMMALAFRSRRDR